MPYIKQSDRNKLEKDTVRPANKTFYDIGSVCKNAGELNYIITKLLFGYYETNGSRYQQINDILGALEGSKMEFYRRCASPYEDKKIEENGDVY